MRSATSYAFGAVMIAVALTIRVAADPYLGSRQAFATFFAATAITAWFAGTRPALLATFLGLVLADWFFIAPRGSLSITDVADLVGCASYLLLCGLVISLMHQMRGAEQRAQQRLRELQGQTAEREQNAAALRASETRMRDLLDYGQAVMANMGEGLYTVDTHGIVTFVNATAERLFGWSREELVGRKMHDVTHYQHPDGRPFPADDCAGLRVLQQGTILRDYDDVFIRKDRTFFPVVYSCSPILFGGRLAGLVVVFRDVTEHKRAEAERQALLAGAELRRAEAEQASRAKDAFLATISHELRTPLSPILAWSRMLKEGALDDEKTARAVETIERCAQAQAQLIGDLLDVSRIVAGKLRLDVRRVDVASPAQAAVDIIRPAAEAKGIRLHVVLDPHAGPVAGDPDRLQQVVWNLLSNAVKFTPNGGRVELIVKKVDSHVEIAVSDTGPGLSPDFLPHVFERFRQADASSTRMYSGLGLGLAIVRHIVELHGGSVHAESPGVDQGAVFKVQLPVMSVPSAGEQEDRHSFASDELAKQRSRVALKGLRILVVDDDPDSNEVVRMLLASCGAEIRVAASAPQALEVMGRWKPDVLVSDIGMPGEDGYDLIRKVRQTEENKPLRLPAVALTAYASVHDRVRLLSAGFQAHVTKPLDPAELIAVVASLARSADLI